MKSHILDAEALKAISPAALVAFARMEGWRKIEPFGSYANVYAADGRPEIILPRTDLLADYPAVVSRLLEVFAKFGDRDEVATYRDIVGADRDVIRVRRAGAEDDGSVPLDVGVKLIGQARDMLLAAACAVRSPQPVYRAGANKDANDYMKRVKLGQTEQGSFVVTMLAPVPPLLQPQLDPEWAPFDEEPLERQVTRRLMTSLEASRNAAEQALSGDPAAFEEAVSAGVSANLCEAVAGLIEQSSALDISVTWARTRPVPEQVRKISFSSADADLFKEAARTLRLKQPKPDVTLYGTVHKLSRAQADIEGVVTLRAIIEDKMQSVRAVLDQSNYSTAVKAHDAKSPVVVTGDLERAGQRWLLINASIRELPVQEVSDEDGE